MPEPTHHDDDFPGTKRRSGERSVFGISPEMRIGEKPPASVLARTSFLKRRLGGARIAALDPKRVCGVMSNNRCPACAKG
jgi:hypothetical protein